MVLQLMHASEDVGQLARSLPVQACEPACVCLPGSASSAHLRSCGPKLLGLLGAELPGFELGPASAT